MSTVGRVALTAALAIGLGATGAAGAAALHWYVVQPSDGELLAAAQHVDVAGLAPSEPLVVSGAWAPSFDRGMVAWSTRSEGARAVSDVVADLAADGWAVERTSERRAWLSATRDGLRLDAWLDHEGGDTRASVSLVRGEAVPSLAATVGVAASAGVLAGVALGPAVRRPSRGPTGGD